MTCRQLEKYRCKVLFFQSLVNCYCHCKAFLALISAAVLATGLVLGYRQGLGIRAMLSHSIGDKSLPLASELGIRAG